jgi:hypothetical protein
MCGVDIDNERWGQSGHEVPETTVNDEIEWGNIQQSTRGRGTDGMQGGWTRRRGKNDCGNDNIERSSTSVDEDVVAQRSSAASEGGKAIDN